MKRFVKGEGTWFGRQVSSSFLFLIGLGIAPAIIIQDNLYIKSLQVILFIGLAGLSKRRLLLVGSLIFFLSTLFFNLLSPLGRVLVGVGPFPITEGALRSGLSKGFTITALIYLSRFCVRPNLILPGSPGRYISKTLFYLNCLLEERKSIDRKDLFKSLDAILEKIYKNKIYKETSSLEKTTFYGVLLLMGLLFLNWAFVFWG